MPNSKIHISIESGGFGLRLQNPNASDFMIKHLSLNQLVELIKTLEEARDTKVESVHIGTIE